MLTVGVDVGGTKIAVGVVDESGRILARDRADTPGRDAGAVLQTIGDLVERVAAQSPGVRAVGIGVAGFVDANRSTVLMAPNLGWVAQPVRDPISARVGLPVVVENDANAAAWGEARFGAGTGVADMIAVTIGTGIGGGLVLGGQLYRGAYGAAAEIGHITVVPGGLMCGCGRRGCWEQYGSGNALVRTARELANERRDEAAVMLEMGDGTPEGINGKHVTLAAEQADPVAVAAFEKVGRWIGLGLADLAATLDPQVFVIGGGVSEAGALLHRPIVRSFEANVVAPDQRPLAQVKLAQLGNDAGIVGAADLARI